MFRIPVELENLRFYIEPYNTSKEKDILLYSSFELQNKDDVLKMLDVNTEIIEKLSDDAKKVLLYKFREISIGDELNIKYTCKHCNQTNESEVSCSDLVITTENDSNILKLNKEVTYDNLQDFVTDIIVDELDLDEYDDLLEKVKKSQDVYNFEKKTKCLKCFKPNYFDISDNKYIIEAMSDDTLLSLYTVYNNMIFFGNMSKKDIDSMYPFERSIFVGLINKTKEDLNK